MGRDLGGSASRQREWDEQRCGDKGVGALWGQGESPVELEQKVRVVKEEE